MTRIAFFGHDAADAAVRRRVQGFLDDGFEVTGFMMRRGDLEAYAWENVDLGQTFDGAYIQRLRSIWSGARLAAAGRDKLAAAEIIYARNLDMLATAFLAKKLTGLNTPVVYECLDVHRLLTRNDPIGFAFRRIEGALLARSRRLVVSSPGFLENYFEVRHKGRYRASLIENRLAAGGDYGPRPPQLRAEPDPSSPLRLGWVGVLRCSRSIDLLCSLADRFGEAIRIEMHGAPALSEVPDFFERIAGRTNMTYHGRYRAPEDLSRIYGGLDLVWAGDFMEAGANSVWLLPNRLYEGGYFAVPPIAPKGTQTAKWIEAHEIGFSAAEDLSQTLQQLSEKVMADRCLISDRRRRLLDLPDATFIQPRGALRQVIEQALISPRLPRGPKPARPASPAPSGTEAAS